MKPLATLITTAALTAAGTADAAVHETPGRDDLRAVAPALDAYRERVLFGDLWKRPGLGLRDRSLVTLAALIARGQAMELPSVMTLALDSGLKPRELSETLTHLAFYAGFPTVMPAVAVAKDVFAQRGIDANELPLVSPELLRLDEASEARRAAMVGDLFVTTAPGVVQYTTDVLFRDLWLRPDLAPRDRSLVTISALIASGQVAQLAAHLGRAMDNGLTQAEAGEAMTQLAFYAGWPNVFTAMPVAREVFEKRARP